MSDNIFYENEIFEDDIIEKEVKPEEDNIFDKEADPEYMRSLALQEMKELNAEKYEKWFKTNANWFKDHYDSLMVKFKDMYPEYYKYICNYDDNDSKRIDTFTDGIDILLVMKNTSWYKLFVLSMQRKYVDDAIERMKQMLQ